MRHCPFDGCGEVIDSRLFACRRHWNKLNCDQKRRIWAAYDNYRGSRISLAQLDARQREVMDEVKEKEAKRGTGQVRSAGG